MTPFFVLCAVIGGTILVCQFVLTLVGFGHDVGDMAHDVSVDVHTDVAADAHDGSDAHGDESGHHGSSWLFGIISFRTLVAACAFFGLAGLAADSAGLDLLKQLVIATVSGGGAMFAVHALVKQMGRLNQDQTLRVQRAIGRVGTVYIPIPAQKVSSGKIQLNLQNRVVEYEAITKGDEKLATGTKVRVVAVRGSILEVEPILQEAST
ncbi:MAG: NfeD family protein [Planctomycetales bacterium]|nr:NfeD family protein [Planctomycetales bacterium]